MKKRTIIILGVPLLLVVGLSIAGYFFFSSPSGQAWERDWIGNPIGLTAIATVGAAVGTVGAVLIAIYGTRLERVKAREERSEALKRFRAELDRAREVLEDERRRFQEAQDEARRQFLASQKQTQDALEEGRRQFLENQYAAHRPLLVPIGRRIEDMPAVINWNDHYEYITLQNTGTGVATNIFGVFMPPEPMQSTYHQFRIDLGTPLPSGAKSSEDVMDTMFKRGGTVFDCDYKIGEHSLCVPSRRHTCVARLTLTCSDIFGRRHASMFDYSIAGTWVQVDILPNDKHPIVQQRLDEMDQAKRFKGPGIEH